MKISKSILHAIATATAISIIPSSAHTQTSNEVPATANPKVLPSKLEVKPYPPTTSTTVHNIPTKSDSTILRPKRKERSVDSCLGCGRG